MLREKKVDKNGFTIIEMVVVTAAIAMIMVAVISVVVATFRSQNQTKSNSKVSSGGNWILTELKREVLSSDGENIVCLDNQLTLTDVNDGEVVVISCDDSEGNEVITANSTNLNSGDISIIDCSEFVSCTTLPSLEVSEVNFKFGVKSDTVGIEASQDFELSVSVRN